MSNPIVHWEYTVKNAKQAQDFYKNLFGWNIDANNPMNYGMVDTQAGSGINGGIAESQDGSNQVAIYVEVDDLQAYLYKAVQLGGKVVMPVTVIPNMVTFAMFEDPTGIQTGLVKAEGTS